MSYNIDAKSLITSANDGLKVFEHYFPGQDLTNKRQKFKMRADEKTASAQCSFYKGEWRLTDFGNLNDYSGMSAIAFVMKQEDLEYIDALKFIKSEILNEPLLDGPFRKPRYSADYSTRSPKSGEHIGDYFFFPKKMPSNADLKSIGRYVTADILEKFNFQSLERYEMISADKKTGKPIVHIFSSTEDYPIFVLKGKGFSKIYKPKEREKKYRFSYYGKKPKNYVFGLEALEDADNEFIDEESGDYKYNGETDKQPKIKDLIRCSGESDALNLASIGCHVYWLNSESASLEYEQFKQLDDLCERHYQIMDLDATGARMGKEMALKHMTLHTIQLPDWLAYQKDWRGNACKDAKDFINVVGDDLDQTMYQFAVLKRKAFAMRFWTKETDKEKKKVNYNINVENYYYFLQVNGFYVTDSKYHKKAGYCYARVDGKVVELISPDDIKRITKRFTKDWIRSKNLLDEVAILNKINSSNQISENNLQDLKKIDLNFRNSSESTEYIHFRGRSIKITRNEIELINQDEVPNYILGGLYFNDNNLKHIIDKKIRLTKEPPIEVLPSAEYQKVLLELESAKTIEQREKANKKAHLFPELDRYEIKINDEDFIIVQFLKDLANLYWRKELEQGEALSQQEQKEQNLLFANILFCLGYMTAEYKNPAKPWLCFLQDMKISNIGESSGRSGKSLLTVMMKQIRQTFYIGGRRKDITEKTEFIYDGFTKFHNIIEIDDLYEFADFNYFYTQITGNREVNSKHVSKQILDYSESGKMIISTNYELQNTNNSTMARLLNTGVSDYYHEQTKYNDYQESRSPFSKFGRMLFDDFTDDEWNKFYNLMAYCIQLQMRFHKIQPPMANLEKRQLLRDMIKGVSKEEEFRHWADNYFCAAPTDHSPNEPSPYSAGYFNRFIKRESAFESFKATLTYLQASKFKSIQFKKSLEAWCTYNDVVLNPDSLTDKSGRIMKKLDGKTTECFYIESDDTLPELKLSEEEQKSLPF